MREYVEALLVAAQVFCEADVMVDVGAQAGDGCLLPVVVGARAAQLLAVGKLGGDEVEGDGIEAVVLRVANVGSANPGGEFAIDGVEGSVGLVREDEIGDGRAEVMPCAFQRNEAGRVADEVEEGAPPEGVFVLDGEGGIVLGVLLRLGGGEADE